MFITKQDLLMWAMMAGYGKTEREPTPEEVRAKAQQDAYITRFGGTGSRGGAEGLSNFGAAHRCRCRCPHCGGSR